MGVRCEVSIEIIYLFARLAHAASQSVLACLRYAVQGTLLDASFLSLLWSLWDYIEVWYMNYLSAVRDALLFVYVCMAQSAELCIACGRCEVDC
jgi:hypothetical protein